MPATVYNKIDVITSMPVPDPTMAGEQHMQVCTPHVAVHVSWATNPPLFSLLLASDRNTWQQKCVLQFGRKTDFSHYLR